METLTVEEAKSEVSRLLRLLPYSVEELDERAERCELRDAEREAYRRITDLQ